MKQFGKGRFGSQRPKRLLVFMVRLSDIARVLSSVVCDTIALRRALLAIRH